MARLMGGASVEASVGPSVPKMARQGTPRAPKVRFSFCQKPFWLICRSGSRKGLSVNDLRRWSLCRAMDGVIVAAVCLRAK